MASLKVGDQGPAVGILQTQLNLAGFPVNAVDDIFGPSTLAAVKAFQAAKGLVADGVVGPLTEAALTGSLPGPSPAPTPAPVPVPAPSSTELLGIDTSAYDPGTNWSKVLTAGRVFAFIKATEGYSYVSALFGVDWRASQSAGVLRGAYHFFRPADDGVQQANHFLATVGVTNFKGSLRPVLDWEVLDGVSASVAKQRAMDFCNTVKAAIGVYPLLYFSAEFFDSSFGDMSEFAGMEDWIAEYASHLNPPSWAKNVAFWQNTDKASVAGCTSPVDGSIFFGDMAALEKLLI
jgi:GH25 family lysozyme M1 (1,4-beta-N-acetylmuramidase)